MDITLFIEHQCNLRCSYCYTGDKFRRPMSEEVIRKTIPLSLTDSPSVVTLAFFGGEPMLRLPLVRRTIELFREHYRTLGSGAPTLRLLMNTNATRLDEEAIALLRDNDFVLNVSLDGPREIHDAQRPDSGGQGSYAKTVEGLRRLETAKIPFQITAVVTPLSAGFLGDVALDLFRFAAFRYTLAPDLSADWSDEALLALRKGAREAATVWGLALGAGHEHRLEPLQTKVLSRVLGGIATAGRCNVSLHEVTVSPLGHLYTCAQQVGEDRDPTYRIGHVETGVDHHAIARLRSLKAQATEVCEACELRSRCASDCGCKQIAASGALGRIDGVLCDTEEAWIDAADELRAVLEPRRVPAFEKLLDESRWKLRPGAELTRLRRKSDSPPKLVLVS